MYAYAALHALYASGLKLARPLRPLRADGWLAAQGSEDDSADGRGECSAPEPAEPQETEVRIPAPFERAETMDTAPQLVWRQMTWL